VQHQPHAAPLVDAQLAEVVAAAHRAELFARIARRHARCTADDFLIALAEPRFPRTAGRCRRIAVRGLPHRNHLFERVAHAAQVRREIVGGQCQLLRDHAAADVDADRGRNDRTDRGDDAADRRALAHVDVRHDRDVVVDERKRGDVLDLAARAGIELDAVDPCLDGMSGGFEDLHGCRPPFAMIAEAG
jgi:hypothetical protein